MPPVRPVRSRDGYGHWPVNCTAELGGVGVGAVGMCFTGGFALAMMVDPAVVAPVVAQPSLPFAVGKKRGADLNLSPADLGVVKQRAADGCAVLGLRYEKDKATGTRFATLQRELGDAFRFIEFPGAKHATLTEHRQQGAIDAVLEFLADGWPRRAERSTREFEARSRFRPWRRRRLVARCPEWRRPVARRRCRTAGR